MKKGKREGRTEGRKEVQRKEGRFTMLQKIRGMTRQRKARVKSWPGKATQDIAVLFASS
jgi:hypothetical protein